MKPAWVAIKFLTVLGRLSRSPGSPMEMGAAIAYFPIVGLLLGMVLVVLDRLFGPILESEIEAVIIIAGLIFLTGAVHLEGTQRTFDRLLAPSSAIVSARSITVYGTVAVVILILLKIRAIEVMGETRNIGLLLAPGFARWAIVLFLFGPARSTEKPAWRIAENVKLWHLGLTTIVTLGFVVLLNGRSGLWVALWVSVLALLSRFYFLHRDQGFNHDQLGALVETSETLSFVLLASL